MAEVQEVGPAPPAVVAYPSQGLPTPAVKSAHNCTVLVYDDRSQPGDARLAWRETRARIAQLADGSASHDDVLSALITFGAYESALADALCAQRDDRHPTLVRIRGIAEWLGRATAASMAGDRHDVDRALRHASHACLVEEDPDCHELRVTVPEGYAYYCLYPEFYADAIVEWATRARPQRVFTIGLRSIGTSLSAIAAGALQRCGVDTESWTLRPRGHPFDRQVKMTPELAATMRGANSIMLIVDEGPGLSGSSMTATAAALSGLGIPEGQICFVPSFNPDPSAFVSAAAAARWRRHRALVPSFDGVRKMLAAEGVVPADAREISAGAWREALAVPAPWPAVHPQHERRKFLCGSSVARFAGLGPFGNTTSQRAQALGDAGWSSRPLTLRRGFLTLPFVAGRPMRPSDATVPFLRHAASYVAWLRSQPGDARRDTRLADMLFTNTREALGPAWLSAAEALAQDASTFSEPAVAIDGRMQPHEWLSTASGRWIKTDALDHHCDHFLPGQTDAAWDVAGFVIEWDLREGDRAAFVDEYVKQSGDRSITRRLPFFAAAYAAFRAGYCDMAAQALHGGDDGMRFRLLGERYKEWLRLTLASVPSAVPNAR